MNPSPFESFVVFLRSAPIEVVVARLMSISLLKPYRVCIGCGKNMSLVNHVSSCDGCCWRCLTRGCEKERNKISIRKDSFFENFRISLVDIFTVAFCWSQDKSILDVGRDFTINKKTTIKIYSMLRTMAGNCVDNEEFMLGGQGVICQIDESLFSHKIKAHRGRSPRSQIWVFGIVEVGTGNFYVEVVPNRSAEVLLPIIRRVVRSGSIVCSDEWAAYNNIQSNLNLEHRTVNHSIYFVDPVSGTYTQNIESCWNVLKYKIKKMKGVRREMLSEYLKEFMWRKRRSFNTWLALFALMRV